MSNNLKTRQRAKTSAVRFFACTLLILFVSSILIWGFQSDWGTVSIKRLYLSGNDGEQISTLIYIPENASNETPAPVVLVMHGRSNHGHSNDTWSMELARRGYVVLSPDLSGGGESSVTDRDKQALIVAEYANTLPYVEKDSLNLIGYSAGTGTCLSIYRAIPEKVNSMCQVFGPFMQLISGGFADVNTNFCLIKSTADQYDGDFLGNPEACLAYVTQEAGIGEIQVNTDYDRNGYLFRYSQIDGTLHQTGNISGTTIKTILDYVTTVVPAPISRDLDDLAWLPQQLFSGIACIDMMFALAALINLLMQLPLFAGIANPVPVKAPLTGAKNWAMNILFAVVIPALIFVHVSAYAMKYASASPAFLKVFTSNNLNGIMAWLLVVALINVIRMIIARKKNAPQRLGAYALGADGETKIDWSKPGKSFLMGLICIVFFGAWMWLMEAFLGIDYQVWNLSTYVQLSPARIVRAIPYVLCIFVAMFIGNMSQRVLPSTGNARKDMILNVAVNTVMAAAALFIILLIQYGGSMIYGDGTTLIPQIDIYGTGKNKSCGALDFAFGYCYMMGGTTGVVTYLYRKYGNIWCGVVPCAIFAGIFTLASMTLVA